MPDNPDGAYQRHDLVQCRACEHTFVALASRDVCRECESTDLKGLG